MASIPRKRHLTEDDKRLLKECESERRAKYTPAYISEIFSPLLGHLPEKYKMATLKVLNESNTAFGDSGYELRAGISTFEVHAKYPKSLNMHVSPRPRVGLQKAIYSKVQLNMIRNNMLSMRKDPPLATHNFYCLKRPDSRIKSL